MNQYLVACKRKFFIACGKCHLTRFLSCGCKPGAGIRWCNCPEDLD